MATYRAIAATETDPFAPLTSALMKALEANPTAIAEGETGAPRVLPLAMVNFAGRSAGVVNFEVDFVHAAQRLRISSFLIPNTSTATTFRMRASSDGGATWGGYSTLTSFTSSAAAKPGVAETEVNLVTGVFACFFVGPVETQRVGGTMSVAVNTNAIQLDITSGTAAHTVYYVGVA